MYLVDKVKAAERLKEIQSSLEIKSARQFAISINADTSYFGKAINGEIVLSEKYLRKLNEKFGINPDWYLYGKDEMKSPYQWPDTNNIMNEDQEQYGNKITSETIKDLATSTVLQSQAIKGFSESMMGLVSNNTKLIDFIISTESNSNVHSKNPMSVSDILTPYLIKMAKAGVGDLWNDIDDGLSKLGKLLVADVAVVQQSGR